MAIRRKVTLARIITNFNNLKNYTGGTGYINLSKRYFVVNCMIRANKDSHLYSVTFKYFANRRKSYRVYLNGYFNDYKSIPHIYSFNSSENKILLCLDKCEYDRNELLSKNVLPWTCEWIYFYELYLITGNWYGNGIHSGGKKA